MSTMNRVSKTHPCPICQKPDWCLTGKSVVLCMRVASQRAKTMADGTVGYLHRSNGEALPPASFRRPAENHVNCAKILQKWGVDYGYKSLNYLARILGVSEDSLNELQCVKSPYPCVWGFPMCDGKDYVIGMRLRHENGKKWCEPGSHNGLFIPKGQRRPNEIVICEGPTDTAAALTIGLYAIGRFNCCGGITQINDFIFHNHIKRVIIVADCDEDRSLNGIVVNPGIQGAITLSEHLKVPSCTVTLPTKDMRQFVQGGGDLKTFQSLTSGLVWQKPHA
jgi:5S rRNA maturation endonuclease (ribonuclease M5)